MATCPRPGSATTWSCPAPRGDLESGLAADSPAQFELRTAVPDGTEVANAFTDSRPICNQDGACTQAGPFGGAKVDKRPPVVTLAFPRPGEQVTRNAAVTTDTVCQDGGSGVGSCPRVALSTSTIGPKTVTVTGTDAVGNATTVTVGYTVIHQWNGFQLPTLDPPFINLAGTGWTYPVRFSISDANRRIDRDLRRVTRIEYQRLHLVTGQPTAPPVVLIDATKRSGLQEGLLGYRYDWKMPSAAGLYRLTVTLDDGTTHFATYLIL